MQSEPSKKTALAAVLKWKQGEIVPVVVEVEGARVAFDLDFADASRVAGDLLRQIDDIHDFRGYVRRKGAPEWSLRQRLLSVSRRIADAFKIIASGPMRPCGLPPKGSHDLPGGHLDPKPETRQMALVPRVRRNMMAPLEMGKSVEIAIETSDSVTTFVMHEYYALYIAETVFREMGKRVYLVDC